MIAASAILSAKLVPNATLKIHPGGARGVCATEKDKACADLLAFAQAGASALLSGAN